MDPVGDVYQQNTTSLQEAMTHSVAEQITSIFLVIILCFKRMQVRCLQFSLGFFLALCSHMLPLLSVSAG